MNTMGRPFGSRSIFLSPPTNPGPPSRVEVTEELSTLAVLASARCGRLLAAGYDSEILAWLPSARDYGGPLDTDFVGFTFDEPGDFEKEVAAAFPDYNQDSLDAWSTELHRLCKTKGCENLSFPWVRIAVPSRSAIHEMKMITLKAGMMPTDLKCFGKAPLRPVPSKVSVGSDPGGGELLLNLAISAGEASGWYEVILKELARPKPTFQASFFAACGRPPPEKIAKLVGSWKRLHRWCVANSTRDEVLNSFATKPNDMADFLAGISLNGKTAAAGLYTQLKCIAKMLLIDLSLDHLLVTAWSDPLPGHLTVPQAAAGLMEVTQLELFAQSQHDCVVNVMAEFMLVLYGMVRPSHIQRSYLVKEYKHCWLFKCEEGKKRIGGVRQPFLWALPKETISGEEAVLRVVSVLRLNPPEGESPWLIRANNHSDPWKATALVDKQMPPLQARRGRASILMKEPLNLDEKTAKMCSLAYRNRRVLPTVGPLIKLDSYEKAALSNWRDTSDKDAAQAAKSMAALYDSSKVSQQMTSKMMCIFAIQHGIAAKKSVSTHGWSTPRSSRPTRTCARKRCRTPRTSSQRRGNRRPSSREHRSPGAPSSSTSRR